MPASSSSASSGTASASGPSASAVGDRVDRAPPHSDPLVRGRGERADQRRLADAGFAPDHDEVPVSRLCSGHEFIEDGEFAVPFDEHRPMVTYPTASATPLCGSYVFDGRRRRTARPTADARVRLTGSQVTVR